MYSKDQRVDPKHVYLHTHWVGMYKYNIY